MFPCFDEIFEDFSKQFSMVSSIFSYFFLGKSPGHVAARAAAVAAGPDGRRVPRGAAGSASGATWRCSRGAGESDHPTVLETWLALVYQWLICG